MAAEVGHLGLAYDYYGEAALMDLEDREHNTRDGVHIASLAGAWIGAVGGFAGMRDHGGRIAFSPRLPEALTLLAFRLNFGGCSMRVEVKPDQATYEVLHGRAQEISHHGEDFKVEEGSPKTLPIPPLEAAGEPPKQPPGREPQRRTPEYE